MVSLIILNKGWGDVKIKLLGILGRASRVVLPYVAP